MHLKGKRTELTQAQKMMVFVLSMSLYGLATLFTELIPSVQLGIVELSVEYFAFIPLTLAILFDPLSAALGAATGEVIFSEIMLGQFGGVGEVEKFVLFSLGIYIAGMMVNDPLNKVQVAIASFTGIFIHQFLGGLVDISKVVFAVEDFEAVQGLPESVFFTEGFAIVNDLLFSGILFCVLPTLFLVPRLYKKIEPLLGMRPRTPKNRPSFEAVLNVKAILMAVGLFLIAVITEFMAETGINFIDWEASWAESPEAVFAGIVLTLVLIVGIILVIRKNKTIGVGE